MAVTAQKPAFRIDGTWTGVAPVQGGGAVKLTFTFRADGNTLRGTVKGVHPVKGYTTTPFRKGRIAGNNFSFTYGDDLYEAGEFISIGLYSFKNTTEHGP